MSCEEKAWFLKQQIALAGVSGKQNVFHLLQKLCAYWYLQFAALLVWCRTNERECVSAIV